MSKKLYSFDDHPEHKAQLKAWNDEHGIAAALNCKTLSAEERERVIAGVKGLYEAAKLEQPRNIVLTSGPITGGIAAAIAAGVWYLRENPDKHHGLFGRKVGEEELMAAIHHACVHAVRAAIDSTLEIKATTTTTTTTTTTITTTITATDAATRAATRDATIAVTRDATYVATDVATYVATDFATYVATRDATDAATRNATYVATIAATRDIIAATHAAARDTPDDATDDATRAATIAAIDDAIVVIATDDATRDTTYVATIAATITATNAATDAATRAATIAAIDDAIDVTAIDDATRDATLAVIRDATYDAATDVVSRFLQQCCSSALNMRTGGNQWSGYVSYLSFFRYVAKLDIDYSKWIAYEDTALAGPRYMHKRFCIVSDRFEIMKRDEQNRPHCENGPSHRWRDGIELYYWHGIKVPAEWIINKANIDPQIVLTWPNVEQRRAAAEIIGWKRVLDVLKPRVLDTDDDPMIGQLLEVDLPDAPKEKFLKVHCGTGRDFVLPVPSEMKTALDANAWTYDIPAKLMKSYKART